MSWASLLGGMALANAGLGAVHGFAAPVGGMFPAPHGAVCAAILPHAMEINLEALRSRTPQGNALKRYETPRACSRACREQPPKTAPGGSPNLSESWKSRRCASMACRTRMFRTWWRRRREASSMKGNPIVLNREELAEIIMRAI